MFIATEFMSFHNDSHFILIANYMRRGTQQSMECRVWIYDCHAEILSWSATQLYSNHSLTEILHTGQTKRAACLKRSLTANVVYTCDEVQPIFYIVYVYW